MKWETDQNKYTITWVRKIIWKQIPPHEIAFRLDNTFCQTHGFHCVHETTILASVIAQIFFCLFRICSCNDCNANDTTVVCVLLLKKPLRFIHLFNVIWLRSKLKPLKSLLHNINENQTPGKKHQLFSKIAKQHYKKALRNLCYCLDFIHYVLTSPDVKNITRSSLLLQWFIMGKNDWGTQESFNPYCSQKRPHDGGLD